MEAKPKVDEAMGVFCELVLHRRDRRQPAARASASLQNHRSPLEELIFVL